jgi:ectoine hydroxylase-related dioxygenase (phytanoyl-CoA dioxygenase family)
MTDQLPADKALLEELSRPFTISDETIRFYRENGYIKLKEVLSPSLLCRYREAISALVAESSVGVAPIAERDTYGRAFLQIWNLWTKSEMARSLVFSERLARIATELMQVSGVRIYHDQALYKEPGGGITPWHADQYYWPVSNDNMITAWIPLQDTPVEMGPLAFCEKSHRVQIGRDLEIGDNSEMTLKKALESLRREESSFSLGDISFHAGWTFHRAGANSTTRPREVMTVIYMDENMRLVEPKNKNQEADIERWCPGIKIGDIISSALNPVLYTTKLATRDTELLL